MEDHQFAWILWYIWKGRNNKVFSNLDIDLRETLRLAEVESTLWAEAQVSNNRCAQEVQVRPNVGTTGRWCFTDGSWKDNDLFSRQGWLSTLSGFDAFESYLEDIKLLRRSFVNSDIVHVPRTENTRADSLARSARQQPAFVVHMDSELPLWFTGSI
ncbi:hypothetical protein YC2023_093482 [Brassica napus]